ncbi:large ATP-binding protein [Amycolatopsis mediterranei S699]|uniref:Large ATP-binding protein n=2 Tax=Amycolatopsis mediterranei TaxID=33910 RepID=A0A0H3DER9_AMYMU|nr:NACHT domain-containing protein [Amycolatopsis mediterranei]ADJ49410.1 large ATP-binding protein [Amycolatopsis mediterranei U32]AEK46381.1 large ATP-binding protein [Amycolatopsis mediterranei S699]AFO81119.1 large ATP-binding protein [Amycolatopsis mediterranei S699]AGT88247.1 large ATP-binding protein [Amycolatopsis mediterranei RB]KDO09334.1 ATP-binding protein [Amycolatopsis mediterranei]
MTSLEGPALKLGGQIASAAAKSWLQRRKAGLERSAELVELAAGELKGPLERAKLENLVQHIGMQVAEQLEPVLADRFSTLPSHEIEAAFLAVEDALSKADLSDEALLATDADPEQLARKIREDLPALAADRLFAPKTAALYELALDQACRHLVQVVRHLPSFPPRALAEVLGRLGRQNEQLEELLARVPKTSLATPEGIDRDAEFETTYLGLLAHELDRLELLGLTMDDQPALPLTVAYLSLSVSPEGEARQADHQTDERWFEKRRRPAGSANMRVETALGGAPRILIRGEAGSGKTTLLDWLAVTAARTGFTGKLAEWNGRVPFPIRLRSFAADPLPRPEEFVRHIAPVLAPPEGWARRVLAAGRAMILVDGVDEVGANHRREVKAWLRELSLAFEDTLFVVTSRTAAADQRWLAQEGFGCVLLEPMSSDDIEALVARWHKAAATGGTIRQGTDLPAVQRRLLNQLDSRPHLRTLAASPLLCAMLCALNLAHRSELPRDRMDLYRKALSMLLHLRDAERKIGVLLTEAQKQVLLGDLAWRLSLASKVELPKDRVREHIARRLPSLPHVDHTPDDVLNHLLERSGVLREPVRDRVDFVHRTFQECLAANEATEQDHLETLIDRAHLDTWWETIVMACGHAKHHQAGTLLTGILDRADEEPRHTRHLRLLAAACLETVSNADLDVIARVEAVIREQLVPPRSLKETRSLASIGDRVLRYLPERLDGLSDAVAAASVRAAALTAGTEALKLLRNYAQDSRLAVQKQLTQAWQYFDPERYAAEVLADSPLADGVATVEAVRLLPHVRHLKNLAGLSVTLPPSERQADLGALGGLPCLTQVDALFHHTTVVDLAPLSDHPGLVDVALYFAHRFTNVRSLNGLQKLRMLSLFRQSPWHSIDAFGDLTSLTFLALDELRKIEDFAALTSLTNLRTLQLWGVRTKTLASSPPLPMPSKIDLFHQGTKEKLIDAAAIAHCFPRATRLRLFDTGVTDLRPLADLPLTMIKFRNTKVPGLRPLAAMSQLETVAFEWVTEPVDLSPLADLKLTIEAKDTQLVGTDKLGPGIKLS